MLVRYETETGETIDILPEKFQPLSYSDLVIDYENQEKQYPIVIDAKSIESPQRAGQRTGPGRVSMPINVHRQLSIFALVDGGWLPPPFVIPPNFLVDRNVVASLAKIRQGNSRPDLTRSDWWFQFFNEFSALINPAQYAFEGNNQSSPSLEEFRRAFDEASVEISTRLPGARLVKYGPAQFRAAYALINDFANRQQRETDFLIKTAPVVSQRLADSQLKKAQAEILKTAEASSLKMRSLVVLAILSCLYERIDGSGFMAARKIIKPRTTYTRQNAYNALSDLRALEIFVSGLGFQRGPFALCTCDRAIAAFWCGLNAHDHRWENEQFSFTMGLTEDLFPRLGEADRVALGAKIAA
jgi:hypothetical protein